MFTQCGLRGVQKVTTRQHLRITAHKKMATKTVAKDDTASHGDEVATSDVVLIFSIFWGFMRGFSEPAFLLPLLLFEVLRRRGDSTLLFFGMDIRPQS